MCDIQGWVVQFLPSPCPWLLFQATSRSDRPTDGPGCAAASVQLQRPASEKRSKIPGRAHFLKGPPHYQWQNMSTKMAKMANPLSNGMYGIINGIYGIHLRWHYQWHFPFQTHRKTGQHGRITQASQLESFPFGQVPTRRLQLGLFSLDVCGCWGVGPNTKKIQYRQKWHSWACHVWVSWWITLYIYDTI